MIRIMRFSLVLLLLCAALPWPEGQTGPAARTDDTQNNPVELGQVRWRRGFDGALAEAAQGGKPLLVLFQEVPG